MTSLSFISGSFANPAAGSVRTVEGALPKISGAKLFETAISPVASSVRNIKDIFTPSISVVPRSTYSPPKQGLAPGRGQNTANQVPKSQSHYQDARNAYLQANKAQHSQHTSVPNAQCDALFAPAWLQEKALTGFASREHTFREGGSEWFGPFHALMQQKQPTADERSVSEANSSGAIVESHQGQEDTGLMDINLKCSGIPTGFVLTDEMLAGGLSRIDHARLLSLMDPAKLEANPSFIWNFTPENKDYAGHDILNAIFPQVYQDISSLARVIDEYGYTFHVPAHSPGYTLHLMEDGSVTLKGTFDAWNVVADVKGAITTVESRQTGLDGLTLEERDLFYAEVQKIFDQQGMNLDVRKESFRIVPSQLDMPRPTWNPCTNSPISDDWKPHPGGWSWDGSGDVYSPINNALLENATLRALYQKAEGVRNGTIADDTLAQQYSIRVTDNDGNRLANDRIIVEAKNGNQVEMSVEQFSNMSRLEITALLR